MKKSLHIPLNTLPSGTREGIVISRAEIDGSPNFAAVERPHRDSGHLFILQEAGVTHIEIDFGIHHIKTYSLVYIHPSQVHRIISFEQATICSWIITNENLQPGYVQLLNDLVPVKPLTLTKATTAVISRAASLCVELADRKEEKLYETILKESCNTLVALAISQYLALVKPANSHSRFELLTKAFKSSLEKNFTTMKSPPEYAGSLNISVPYLNECVKNTTGLSVTQHIQQRIMLEAKRLLFHSHKSVKEIAGDLGYDDYSYFTRLFVKVTGMTPIVFRSKNLE